MFRIWGLGLGLGFRIWGLGFGVWGGPTFGVGIPHRSPLPFIGSGFAVGFRIWVFGLGLGFGVWV